MIKPFSIGDLGYFVPNNRSNPDRILPLLVGGQWETHTMWSDNDMVKAIMCFNNYWGNCWSCFVLLAHDFTPTDSANLREIIVSYMVDRKAVRLQTESHVDPMVHKWHKFLGFTHEGTKSKMMFNTDYDMWAIVREED